MSERSPMYEPFKRKQKEEEKERFGGIIEKVIIGGAVVGALAAGTVGYEKYVAPHNENIINNDKTGFEDKIKMEEELQKLIKDPRVGYVDLNHYLEDHREIRENSEEYKAAEKYFKAREEK